MIRIHTSNYVELVKANFVTVQKYDLKLNASYKLR